MTVRATAMQTCDRCLKPFNEKHLKAGEEVPTFKQQGLVVTETTGTNKDPEPKFSVLFSFDDMCPDCRKAVENLLAKLRLDGAAAKKPRKKRVRKPKEPKPPETPEYTEDPPAEAKGDDASPPEEQTEPEPQDASEAQEPAPETTEEPPAEAQAENSEPEEPELANEPGETSDGGNGAEASSEDDDGLVEDPSTGDKYDPATGEVKVKGSKNGDKRSDIPF